MKKTLTTLALLACMALAGCNRDNDPRLVIITYDGLRWQELFTGVDSALVGNKRYVSNPKRLKETYWRNTPEERREVLLPFTWSYIAQNGYLIGNRDKGSLMQVANKLWFSYPGYSENFCGYPDDERITSNDAIPNPNTSVLEVANRDPRYKGKVVVYGSWESIRYAVNNERGGFPGSVAYEPNVSAHQDETMQLLDEMLQGSPHYWGGVRFDAFTYAYAKETLKKDHPKVMYIAFGESDDWAHNERYDFTVESIRHTDGFIKGIVEACESDPYYKGKTTYLLTCDHGRGRRGAFTSHGDAVIGSNQTWFIAFGKGVDHLGETTNNGPFYNQQFAATIAEVLGIDFTPDNGVKQAPIDPTFKGDASQLYSPLDKIEPQRELGFLPAIKNAQPKGYGISYKLYFGDFKSVDQLAKAPVVESGVYPDFAIDLADKDDHFGYEFQTLIKIPKTGRYELTSLSDDGIKVWIDGQLLIEDDGTHFATYSKSSAELEEGYHRLYVKYFEAIGGEWLEIGLRSPDGKKYDNIPTSMMFYE